MDYLIENERHVRARAAHVLKKLPIFAGLDDEEYGHLIAICKSAAFAASDTIFKEGDHSDNLYVILKGSVRIESRHDAHIGDLGVGDIFGEIGVICQIRRTADATATAPTTVLKIEKHKLAFLLGRHARMSSILMKNLAQVLANRLIEQNHKKSKFYT